NRPASERLRLSGEIASPVDPDPKTCRFAGRCPHAQSRCREAMPTLLPLAPGHAAACHFPLAGRFP
ncbi:MAG: peptide ABC transporter ATP-binding protein, partial [Methylobacterium sp.]|nr:peptide ABC transporter ATP-binding protein [Methylobacterium sp.]